MINEAQNIFNYDNDKIKFEYWINLKDLNFFEFFEEIINKLIILIKNLILINIF